MRTVSGVEQNQSSSISFVINSDEVIFSFDLTSIWDSGTEHSNMV